MTEKTKRVPVSEYPGACDSVWRPAYADRLEPLDYMSELSEERGMELVAERHRPSTMDDVDVEQLAVDAWEHLREILWESETLGHGDGSADLPGHDSVCRSAWIPLVAALRDCIAESIDLSDAAWQETGERVRIYPDGTVERIDAGGDP